MQEFHRISRLPPYVFNIVNELKAKARAAGEDIIDFGMGNPDQPKPALMSIWTLKQKLSSPLVQKKV